ncbi:MAG: hypothetical protein VB096_09600 [Pseudoflavonifractor sp.]|nr:hypothetical protein [Pseudoflavonifractor sp.]
MGVWRVNLKKLIKHCAELITQLDRMAQTCETETRAVNEENHQAAVDMNTGDNGAVWRLYLDMDAALAPGTL